MEYRLIKKLRKDSRTDGSIDKKTNVKLAKLAFRSDVSSRINSMSILGHLLPIISMHTHTTHRDTIELYLSHSFASCLFTYIYQK
jgi:hypothetical protein